MTDAVKRAKPRFQTSFYGIISLLTFVVVIGGFSTTYFIPISDGVFEHKNPYIHIHALVGTLWLLAYIVQTHLVAAGNRALHMALGKAGALVALLFVVTGVLTFVAMTKIGIASADEFQRYNAEILGVAPVIDLTLFTLLVGAALRLRKQPQAHKRFIYIASCLFVTPGMFRVMKWWIGDIPSPENGGLMIPLTFTAFIVAGPIYDKYTTGKVDRTYWWALPVWALVFFGVPVSIATGFWAPVAQWVGGF